MSIDAMKQALEALEELADEVCTPYDNKLGDAILALRAAIEQPRQWQRLTDEDREEILRWVEWKEIGSQPVAPQKLIAYVERKLREKNT